MAMLSKISPCLWFDDQAEDAAAFYTKVFDGSRIVRTMHNTASGAGPEGSVLLVDFEIEGLQFTALNGGPQFTFSEAVSFQILCDDQAEVDRYWDVLVDGGEAQPCGWLKDRFGVSWQITPTALYDLLMAGDPERIDRAMKAVLASFGKPDLAEIQRAAAGG
jgi:predicted 3-demethylubiquinone-9 3-methyltransferase (glyoxalase superfamily)